MRRLIAVCAAVTLACGGSDATGPGDSPDVVAAISVEQGARQSARPMRAMPDSVVARATDAQSRAVEGRIVEFQLPAGPDAGSVDQQTLSTNPQGRVFYELTAGPRAWTSRVAAGEDSAYTARLVASVDGRSDEVVEFTFAVQPGEPVVGDARDDNSDAAGGGLEGDTPHVVPMDEAAAVRDEHGNPVPWGLEFLDFAHAEETDGSFGGVRTVIADSVGCAPFYVRTDGGRGVKADSGIVKVLDHDGDGTADRVDMHVGSNAWDPAKTDHEECVQPYL